MERAELELREENRMEEFIAQAEAWQQAKLLPAYVAATANAGSADTPNAPHGSGGARGRSRRWIRSTLSWPCLRIRRQYLTGSNRLQGWSADGP